MEEFQLPAAVLQQLTERVLQRLRGAAFSHPAATATGGRTVSDTSVLAPRAGTPRWHPVLAESHAPAAMLLRILFLLLLLLLRATCSLSQSLA